MTRKKTIVGSRGRAPENPAGQAGGARRQRLEPSMDGTAFTLTTVLKDNMVLEEAEMINNNGDEYRIRRLTARECWRLMGFSDDDYDRAAEVCSETQLYRQAGNSIVENVLVAIFGQMLPGKEDRYRDLAGPKINQ